MNLYDWAILLCHRYVVLIPEEPEDMWHTYNLVTVGDILKSTTIRYCVLINWIDITMLISDNRLTK